MGCDIHSVIQGQWLDTDQPDQTCWHTVAEGWREQDYDLFGFLAGVRNQNIAQFADRRGLPQDFLIRDGYHPLPRNFRFRDTSFGPDDTAPWEYSMGEHSFTWYGGAEVEAMLAKCPDDLKPAIARVVDIMRRLKIRHGRYTHWRVVIGFDS